MLGREREGSLRIGRMCIAEFETVDVVRLEGNHGGWERGT